MSLVSTAIGGGGVGGIGWWVGADVVGGLLGWTSAGTVAVV